MQGSIHFYVINLKQRTDRWKTFSEQRAVKKIMKTYPFERFDAIAGSTIDVPNDTRISMRTRRNIKESSRRDHEDLNTAGGIGCYLSHVEVWKKIAMNQEEYGIIFEDDTKLPDDFLTVLKSSMKDLNLLPEMPDVWTFSYGWDFFYKTKGKELPQNITENHRGPWIYNTCPGGLNGYLVTREGAKKLLENAFPIDMHVDLYICMNVDLKKILCVAHKDLILNLLVESEKSDIQLPMGCTICNVPNNLDQKGMVVVNVPMLIITLGIVAGLMVLNGFTRRR
jgi:GR25 family glycosyltransferase involved in LPS biosynthesis